MTFGHDTCRVRIRQHVSELEGPRVLYGLPTSFCGSCVRRRRAASVAVSQSTISAHGAPPAPASLACVPCRLTRRPPVGLIVHDYDKLNGYPTLYLSGLSGSGLSA